ncbi:MAG: acetyl-CoA acetyltransferase [Acidobacteria bacterium 13_1_40CM_65_14]|nr:MAG: acetyl-CoA acetyltransferase [Acidobacteria bacterium 13_1_40CM_65_14]OLC83494.1 MAG: acetyl-CoA acetyltransferase [Acidobacteria bacterium 13_1_40CM_4_65_8]OLE78526.1 MAG: acetyl-CoA acetyltransferase [Acidobacteria bacterium 13_1_20CM_2_65_9]
MSDFETVILSACRTPVGAFGGVFKDVSAADLGAVAIREAIARAEVKPADVGDVVMGCVLQAGAGMNVARQAALKAGVPVEVPGETVNRVCGSGLQAVVHAVEAIRVGYVDTVVAGGTESMSNAPYLLKGARWGYRMGHAEAIDSMLAEGLTCAMGACHMGVTAEEVASRYNVSRADQDAFAAESQQRAERAIKEDRFKDEIVPVLIPQKKGDPIKVDTDEYPRPGTTAEKLAALKPAFKKDGSVTAGNASGINDGAAALVVTTGDKAKQVGKKPLARILSYVSTGVDPGIMGMGPVSAVRKVLERAGLTIGDIDLFELNEAFAAQALAVGRELGLDVAKVNVNGGAIALGHPIGASGARVLTTLLYALRARKLRYGVASLCIGGGMGIAMAVEAL